MASATRAILQAFSRSKVPTERSSSVDSDDDDAPRKTPASAASLQARRREEREDSDDYESARTPSQLKAVKKKAVRIVLPGEDDDDDAHAHTQRRAAARRKSVSEDASPEEPRSTARRKPTSEDASPEPSRSSARRKSVQEDAREDTRPPTRPTSRAVVDDDEDDDISEYARRRARRRQSVSSPASPGSEDGASPRTHTHMKGVASAVVAAGKAGAAAAGEVKMTRRNVVATFKLIALGHAGAGKTSLCARYANARFDPVYKATVGLDFFPKRLAIDGKDVNVQVWDTAGQERFRSISPSLYRGMAGALLVYDVCDVESFGMVAAWMRDIHAASGDLPMVLVANKCDRAKDRTVSRAEGKALAESLRIQYYEASAKTGEGVDEAFEALLAQVILSQYPRGLPDVNESTPFARSSVDVKEPPPATSCAC